MSLRNHQQPRQRVSGTSRRGAAAVEFALIAPLFFLLLAGIMEFGQVFKIEHMLSNASRRGARVAVLESTTSSQVQQLLETHCVETLGVTETDVTVEIAVNGNTATDLSLAVAGDEISVTVGVPFSEAGTGFYAGMFSNANLSSTCVLERE